MTFTNLAPHTSVTIAFLLGFLESWDSRDSGTSFGPDNLDVLIDGVQILSLTADNALGTFEDYAGGTELADDAQINDNTDFSDTLVDMSTASALSFAHTSSSLVVRVRADTGGFMAGVNDIQRTLDGPFAAGLDRAGGGLSRALGRALSDGKLGFDDLRRLALSALGDIAQDYGAKAVGKTLEEISAEPATH